MWIYYLGKMRIIKSASLNVLYSGVSRSSPILKKTSVFSSQELDEMFLIFYQKSYLIVYYTDYCEEKKFCPKAGRRIFLHFPSELFYVRSTFDGIIVDQSFGSL
jgi:hypothetical protein